MFYLTQQSDENASVDSKKNLLKERNRRLAIYWHKCLSLQYVLQLSSSICKKYLGSVHLPDKICRDIF